MSLKEEIEAEIEAIRQIAPKDEETAHIWEDALHRRALREIANSGASPYSDLATLVLTTLDIKFKRHCA